LWAHGRTSPVLTTQAELRERTTQEKQQRHQPWQKRATDQRRIITP